MEIYIKEADAVILCFPDAASIEAANMVDPTNDQTVIIYASIAFHVNDDWTSVLQSYFVAREMLYRILNASQTQV